MQKAGHVCREALLGDVPREFLLRLLWMRGAPGRDSALAGCKPAAVAWRAVSLTGYTNRHAADLTKAVLLQNLDIAGKLGCLADAGLSEMRRGQSPTVQNGPCKGQELTVDHIIPLAVAPELGNVIANLELLPSKLDSAKRAKVTTRQVHLAKKLRAADL